jgi:hypothetical protein
MKLTDTAVRKAKLEAKPRKLADGGGLYVMILPHPLIDCLLNPRK